MDESHKHKTKQKKSHPKKYVLHHSIYKYKTGDTSVWLESSSVVTGGVC